MCSRLGNNIAVFLTLFTLSFGENECKIINFCWAIYNFLHLITNNFFWANAHNVV